MVSSVLFVTICAFQVQGTPVNGFRPNIPETKQADKITPEMRGDIFMARKMYREAIEMYKTGPLDSAVLANKIGIGYHQLLDLESARKWYEKAIKMHGDYAEAVNNLGTIYYAKKSYRRAVSQYKKALRITPDSASILSNLGTAYFARKNYDLAFATYQQALKLDPEVFEHRSSMGVLLQDRTVEERAKFHYYLAKTYAKSGDVERALIYIRKALEEGFKDPDKFKQEPEFAAVRKNPEFDHIISAEHKVL
ncbi:MAG TPA: tetratricopeptide repeat protein [Bryobacteraceae bacterium]|nr:tetratricopeptide repeat protein [Bryobacteraceae bacterium]